MESQSVLTFAGLPSEFGVALLLLALILLLAPYLAGHDLGLFKIPAFSEPAKRRLRFLGPIVMLAAIGLHIPILSQGKRMPEIVGQ